ncbi:hypothetical protein [Kribbella deserti]|uniref:Chromate transporter n=1 Tax=Kribbella deserti TaxID=1926257 RepID=A0ABV6QP51_9ACTN
MRGPGGLGRSALSTEAEITALEWKFFPTDLQWGNVGQLFSDDNVPMAGYGLARIPCKHADKVFYGIVGTLMIPGAVTFIPSFIVVSSLGWVGSLRGLIIPTLFSGFAAFLFRQYFLGFPRELEGGSGGPRRPLRYVLADRRTEQPARSCHWS